MLLQQRELVLRARNARYPFGEFDLVTLDGRTLAFVEARRRQRTDFGGAAASVGRGVRRGGGG